MSSNNHLLLHLRTLACAVIVATVRGYRFIVLALALSAGPGAGAARAAGRQVLYGHVPAAVAQLPAVDRLAGANRLRLAIGLPLRNTEQLNQLLRDIYDPSNLQFRHYLTPEQFTERFGPTEADYQALIKFAQANGFAVTATHPNRVVLDVESAVTDIEKAFHLTMRNYQHPTEARTFFAPDTEPSLDLAVPILNISGLDNYVRPFPKYKRRPAAVSPMVTPRAFTGSGPGGNYIGWDFRNAYVPGTTLTGTGQSVALFELDGYYTVDITNYEALAGLPNVPLVNVGSVTPGVNGGIDEVSLDIEMVISMAPGLAHVYVYEGLNPDTVLNQIATDNLAKQISCSWGWTPGPDLTADAIFQQMAAQGQSFFNASGDSDAFPTGTADTYAPTTSTNITQVGGTTLTMTSTGVVWSSETVWNWGGGTGSSGGISSRYAIPYYQQGISMTANGGSTTMRNVPDVALTADNVYVIANKGVDNGEFGGTSCAAPLWAAFTALVNQQAAANSLAPIGFLNPAFYTIGKGANYTDCFHDITTGNNNNGKGASFSAVAGYDLCTGWGTPNGTNLINRLAPNGPNVVLSGTMLLAEGCSPTNGVIDPDETVIVAFTLMNSGNMATTNLIATLLATNGVTAPGSPQTYGVLVASGGTATQPFTFTAAGACGGTLTATLQLQDGASSLGTVTNTFTLGQWVSVTPLTQTFDSVTAPALPPGWTTTNSGAQALWVTSTGARDTSPNAAFTAGANSVGVNELVSPAFPVYSAAARLSFRNNYNLQTGSSTGRDGGVLEIKIGTNAFTDILAAGGAFISNGYVRAIGTNRGNPLGGRQAWTGNSGGFLTTIATLPAAAAGQTIQLKWRCGTDNSGSSTGWYVDTISVTDGYYNCCTGLTAPVASFSANPTTGTVPLAVTFTDTSTGTITNRFWTFGDGATTNTTTTTVLHTYTVAGTDTVTLAVSGPGGAGTNTQSNPIVALTPPQLGVTPASYNFGTLATGTTAQTTFIITNLGGATLSGTAAAFGGPFTVVSGGIYTVAGFAATNVIVQFAPASAGAFSNSLAFTSNGGNLTNPVQGVGAIVPVAGFNGSLTNGTVPLAVTFTDTSTGTITNRFWNFGDGATTNTTATNVLHTYTVAGSNTVQLIASGPVGSSTNIKPAYIIALTPPQLGVSPASYNFGTLATGTTAQTSFTVTNTGGATLTGTAAALGGPFTVVSGGIYTVAGFAATNVVVQFAPASAGAFSNSLAFTSNGGNLTNPVQGVGAIVPVAGFNGSPTNGTVPLAVTFTDTSTGTITNRFWNFGDGTTTNTTATTMLHTYTVAGTDTVTLVVSGPVGLSTNTQTSYIIALTPAQMLVTPASQDFNTIIIGQTNSHSFLVINTGQSTLTGTAGVTSPFSIAAGGAYTVPGGATNSVLVNFEPVTAGPVSNLVVFTGNGGSSSNAVTGAGLTPPQLAVTPASYDFGTLTTGATAQASFTITNLGDAPLTGTVAVTGPFAIIGSAAYALAGLDATNVLIGFTPVSAGCFTNDVIFASNGGNVTNAVSGCGAMVPVAQFSASPTNGAAPLTVTFSDTSTGTITNRYWNFGDAATTNTTGTNLIHTYTGAGTNTVTLIVSGPVGMDAQTQTNLIIVTLPPPAPEFLAGSGVSLDPATGQAVLTFAATNGYQYQIVYKDDLQSTNEWQPVEPPGWLTATNTEPMTITDPGSASSTQRFYRLEARIP